MSTRTVTRSRRTPLVESLQDRIGESGRCVGSPVPHRWHPRGGFTRGEQRAYAAWACGGCPVQAECALLALLTGQTKNEAAGVWGGLCPGDLADLGADPDSIECLTRLVRAAGGQP